ncbi:MAG: LuxR C-terminal-related transcriptional regulator, partial [Pseudomonadota bacterium]
NTKEIINSLRDAGLFIFSLNPESGWFRYHHLFSNFLRGVLQFRFPEYESRLHIQASDWFWNKGFIQEAFTHALKGNDESRAAKILDTHCAQILNEGRPAQLLKMSEHLTNNAIQDFPNLALTKAWALIVHWRFEQAQLFINIAEDAISRQRKQHEGADGYFSKLYWKLLHVKMLYARFRDQLDEVRSHCNQLLSEHNIDEPDVLGVAYDTLIHVETDQFDFSRINYLERKTLHLLEERDRTYIMIWHKATIGRARLLEGDSQAAIAACEQGIASAQALGAELSHFASIPGLVLAETHYLRNEIEDARTLCDRYWSNFSQIGFPEQVISAILVRSRILRIDNKVDEANALVMEGMRQGDAQRFGRLQRYMAYELIGDALSNGKLRTARDIFDKHVSSNSNTFSPGKNANGSSDRKALAWTRLALAEGEYAAARKTAMRWRDFTFQAGACLSMTRWNILLSVIALRDGDERAALRHLRDAVRAARPGRYIQPFLKEGQPIQELLTHLHAASATSSAAEREFTANVLNAFPGQGAPHANKDETPQPAQSIEGHVYGAIADRELEILNCLASGLSNREIGDILGMTEGTVKWHLQQIYNKLGVRRRQLALNKAMRLGLIN